MKSENDHCWTAEKADTVPELPLQSEQLALYGLVSGVCTGGPVVWGKTNSLKMLRQFDTRTTHSRT